MGISAFYESYQSRNRLDPDQVVATIEQLSRRIKERFPEAELIHACDELLRLSREAKTRATWIDRPIVVLRLAVAIAIALIAFGLISALSQLSPSVRPLDVVLFVSVLEASINNVLLLAAAIYFLVTIETRIKRKRSLVAIHDLRSLAHIIDMHQLTKDPDRLLSTREDTKSSPATGMTLYQMSRYLDYCGEMLSLIGKIAAIYGFHWNDAVALQSIANVEQLTTDLSQKIFQKVMILHDYIDVPSGSRPT